MVEQFFEAPVLNSAYEYPGRHWELDSDGQPTGKIIDSRRQARLITPIPQPQKQRSKDKGQPKLGLSTSPGVDTAEQEYDPYPIINQVRTQVDQWRGFPRKDWDVTSETARLLEYWRHHEFQNARPFFCQLEAVETLIWLTEVAPSLARSGLYHRLTDHINAANAAANPELQRIALKLATGAGKTTVMAMIIAWQTINAVRYPQSKSFTRGFLIVTPGITIKDRLRVLLPNDPNSYYVQRELVPAEYRGDLDRAEVVITNYHAFRLREKFEAARGTRALLQGRGPALQTTETDGEMIRRVMKELMGMRNILALNDEAHHCYREKPVSGAESLSKEDRDEANRNNETARLWISGLETVKRKLGIRRVVDLSATPFFLRGSGYAEGSLFPWTVSDFSLMDAIESGIVKLPRIPIADNVPGGDMPKLRNLWDHIGSRMPKGARSKGDPADPAGRMPAELLTALNALYGHYEKTFLQWEQAAIGVPPVFIIVASNTSASKMIYDYIAGFERDIEGQRRATQGAFKLFQNYDSEGRRLPRPNTLLIDSEQLESGDALDAGFREAAYMELEQFRREFQLRGGSREEADKLSDADILREVMNTVGREGRLGETVRCVVSVSMLTEGWDANTVTHILGVRAFGTQLLCEQVVGRALRRQSYEPAEDGKMRVEYADILGIPFAFTAEPVAAEARAPRKATSVYAVSPERDDREIIYPRVVGYRLELPAERLEAKFSDDCTLRLTPELVGPSITRNSAIIGERIELTMEHLEAMRPAEIEWKLTHHLLLRNFRDPDDAPKLHLFGQLRAIVGQWISGGYLRCSGETKAAQVLYPEIADRAAERIRAAISQAGGSQQQVLAIVDHSSPLGSTRAINFSTTKTTYRTDPRKCHVNAVAIDSDWEAQFCRLAEGREEVICYVKNQNLGLEVPYRTGGGVRRYIPDFLVRINDGNADPLNLVVEVKGYRGEDAIDKANTMKNFWVPGVNNLGRFGRWDFIEFRDVHEMDREFDAFLKSVRTEARR
ncbi:MAG: DEAD/DEAH box helicase family protein [Leptospirales bacterium]|nr:DEAD/DEAH box helicase family protein [Leptospirales bacterium]